MILTKTAPAKVNLGLHVLRKRNDGYHDIETVFLGIGWCDVLRVTPSDGFTFTCSDPALPVDERNLCVRAARLLMESAGEAYGGALHLEKRLPYGAGLGSGSSDAAATLLLLREFWRLDASNARLHELGAALGADVPFFLQEGAAYGHGRGDRLTPLRDDKDFPYECPYAILVVAPDVHVATAEAYQNITPRDAGRPNLREVVVSNDLARWREELVNDFERFVFAKNPLLQRLKNELYDAGAGYAAMSGSGSALFGVFEDPDDGLRLHRTLASQGVRSHFEARMGYGI